MDSVIEGRSAAEHTENKPTSATEMPTESWERMQIEGTSAAAEPTEIEATSDAEPMEIEATSAAAEPSENKVTSATEDPTEIEATSAAAELTEIEAISAAAEPTENRERTQWPENSIFRAPEHIRSGRESNFEPKLVSIGPYYHGRQNLKRMEDLKLEGIKELQKQEALLRANIQPHRKKAIYNVSVEPSTQGEMIIEDVAFEKFNDLGKRARAYYKQEFKHSDVEFVWMLVIDSCFILRIILSLSKQVEESMAFLDVHIKDIKSDLLLLENQIPLFFIENVYRTLFFNHVKGMLHFNNEIEPFLCLDMPWRINHDAMSNCRDAAHLLDLYWRCSLSPVMYEILSAVEGDLSEQDGDLFVPPTLLVDSLSHGHDNIRKLDKPMVIANANELYKMAGIEFETFKDKGQLDVVFSKGIMQMPRLKIDSRQKTLLVNVIAFENCILPCMRNFSYYMKLMDALIDSEQDVQLLQKCGVIYNTLRSHEMAATFFNEIGNICFTDNSTNPFSGLYKDVQKYYNSSWHRRLASLRHNYFSSPWAGISVVAGVILLILSLLQTFYSVYGYYKPRN